MSLRIHPKSLRAVSDALTATEKGECKSVPAQELRRSVSRQKVRIPVPFGKYQGLTLPQVLFVDPDYFFWLEGVLKGVLATEAEEIARKACRVRIPREPAEAFMVEYIFERDGKFVGFRMCGGIENDIQSRTSFTERLILIFLIFETENVTTKVGTCGF
jgi:hypothetical protein